MEQIQKDRNVEIQLKTNILHLKKEREEVFNSYLDYKKKDLLNIYDERIDLEKERLKNRQPDFNIKKENVLKKEENNLINIRQDRFNRNKILEQELKYIKHKIWNLTNNNYFHIGRHDLIDAYNGLAHLIKKKYLHLLKI